MDTDIVDKFQKMGARVRIIALPNFEMLRRWAGNRPGMQDQRRTISVDIRSDRQGEFFDIRRRPDVQVQVIDVKPSDRHLLLMAREPRMGARDEQKSKFLCGHDERSWFVAAIPEDAGAKDVQTAKDALKPKVVWDAIRQFGVPRDQRDRRKTAAFVRQGEWFFIPRMKLKVDEKLILKNEPIRRGSGKPHICAQLFRVGGTTVHVSAGYPNGLTAMDYFALPQEQRDRWSWRVMSRDARAYVKGTIRHPDHATVRLDFWHEVVMNTETRARAMQHVAFLD